MNVGGMFTTANHEMMKTPVRRRQKELERAVMNNVLEMEDIAAEIDEAQNLLYSIWFFSWHGWATKPPEWNERETLQPLACSASLNVSKNLHF